MYSFEEKYPNSDGIAEFIKKWNVGELIFLKFDSLIDWISFLSNKRIIPSNNLSKFLCKNENKYEVCWSNWGDTFGGTISFGL